MGNTWNNGARWILEAGALRRLVGMLALCASSSLATAGVVFTASDLPDVIPGQDLWHYSYTVSGPLPAFSSVNLLFSSALYSDLFVTGSGPEVIGLETQPDASLGADGQLTVTAIIDLLASTSATVDLDFVWLSVGAPGSQAFEVLDDQFNVIGSGQTALSGAVQTVPEPGTLGLLGLSLFAVPVVRRHQHRRVMIK